MTSSILPKATYLVVKLGVKSACHPMAGFPPAQACRRPGVGSMHELSLGRFDHSGAFQMCLVFARVIYRHPS